MGVNVLRRAMQLQITRLGHQLNGKAQEKLSGEERMKDRCAFIDSRCSVRSRLCATTEECPGLRNSHTGMGRRASAHPSTRSREQATARRCGYVQKNLGLLCPRTAMSFQFIEQLQHKDNAVPVEQLCRVLEVSRSGYYAARKRRQIPPAVCQASVHLKAAFAASGGAYGSRRPRAAVALARRRNGPLSRAQFDAPG
jgi:hypothetical protein